MVYRSLYSHNYFRFLSGLSFLSQNGYKDLPLPPENKDNDERADKKNTAGY